MMPRKLALLIGVSEYGADIPDLSAPVFDLEAMKRVLENKAMGGFESVKTLLNPDPTAMRLGVQQIFAGCSRDDLVLLFFSGHGITDDNNRLYFATKGTAQDYYKATSVAASFIQDVSLDSYAKRQVIVLDCCYSGAFAEGWQSKSIGLNLQKELGAEGRVVLTSSSATQKSFQQTGQELSLYTKYFVEGIETGAAGNKEQGKIYAFELHEYAKAKVQEVKPKQQPAIIIDREGYKIILSQAPINDPELEFRRRVEKYAAKGSISNIRRRTLEVLRKELGITEDKSEVIINEVLAPYRQHLQNIEFYRQVFTETVEQHYPLTTETLSELLDLQDVLGLEEQDVAAIKAEILAAKDAESQQLNNPQDLPKNRITNPELVSPAEKPNFLSKLFSPLFQMSASDYFNRAWDKQNKGDYQGAIADYEQAIKLQPDYTNAYNNRGIAYRKLGRSEEHTSEVQTPLIIAYADV